MRAGFWTKIKGLLGLGAVGAGLGAIVGTAWFTISGLLAGTVVLKGVANAAIVYGSFGFFTASGLGLLLANARSKVSLDEVSVAWSGLIGAVAGAAFPLVFNVLMLQSLLPLRMISAFLPIMGALGLFGGALTAGMVAAAKHEHRKEVGSGSAPQLLED
jgi:hypothetical protein